MVFHGFWLGSMVFQGGFMVFHGFLLVSVIFQGGFMVFMGYGWFRWSCWLKTPQNCILAQRSSLGLETIGNYLRTCKSILKYLQII